LRLEVARLKQLDRAPQAARAVARLIELDKGDPDTLAELLEWLITQKDWQGVDRLAERFAAAVEATPALLYLLAEARADQGRAEKAEQIARQALALNPGGGLPQASLHLMVAVNLQQRGRFAWAEREYRQAAGAAPPTSDLAVTAMCYLAEMFHDQAQERQAGEVLQQVVEALGANRPNEAQAARRTLGEIRARMNFFFACHWQAQGDEAQRRAYLDKGLAADPTDVDVLIGCYRLGPAPPEFRRKIQKLIADAVKDMREKIADDLDSPSNYNQVAWLVANTEGNLDQALADSNKSIELSPRTGGYYDTLGRVYFARGDYENAVKNQTRAAELEPHSGQIIRQLELFRKTRAEKQKTDLPSPSGRGAGGEGTGKSQKQGGTFSRPTALTISRRERGPGIRSLQVAMEQARRSPATIITN
jgi:tetratricopeptide (TPR) repeat protein